MDTARLPARLGLLFWLVIAGTFYGLTFNFDDTTGDYAWGPAAWPRAVLLLMVVGAIVNYIANRPAPGSEATGRAFDTREVLSTVGMIAVPLIYLWLIPRAGFYVSTLVFLLAYMAYLGERRWPYLLTVTVFLFAAVNVVFTRLFYVALPTGSWPVFYDVSNWFVTFMRM